MNILGPGLLWLSKAAAGVPTDTHVVFIPLEKTAGGWNIQLNGRIFFAATDKDFIPGQPVKAKAFPGTGGLRLEVPVVPQEAASGVHALLTTMAARGKPFIPSQIDRLQRLWSRTPGATEGEKARLLWELEEGGLAWLNMVRGLSDLWEGNWFSGGGSESSYSQDSQEQKDQEKKNREERTVNSEASASADLFNSKPSLGLHRWILVPFQWKGPHGEAKGLSKFKINGSTGQLECWNFSLLKSSWGFLMRCQPVQELTVFHPATGRELGKLSGRLSSLLGTITVTLKPHSFWDGFEGISSEGRRTIDETV